MQKDFQLTVDIENKIRTPSFEVNTLDLKTVRLQITIIQGMSLVDLTGITVRMSIQKPDKNVLFQDCKVVNAKAGLVEIVLDNQAYLLPGKYNAELMCFQGAEIVAVTGSFSYSSSKGILTDEAVESKSEFTAITGKIKEVEDVVTDLRENGTGIDAQARADIGDIGKKLTGFVNLKEFGAAGDGVTDDTQAFQDALNTALTDGFLHLHVPDGTYLIDGYAEVFSNTHLLLSKGAKIIKGANSVTSYVFYIGKTKTSTGYGSGAKNITIEGGRFEGYGDSWGTSITCHHVSNFKVKDTVFYNAVVIGHILDLGGCDNVLIEECDFIGFSTKTGREFTEAIQLDNSSYEGMSGLSSNYDGLPTKDVTVSKCRFLPIKDENGRLVKYAPNPIGSHNFVEGQYFQNINFVNNIVVDCPARYSGNTGCWLRFYAVDGINIQRNKFINTLAIHQTCIGFQTKTTGVPTEYIGIPLESNIVPALPCKNILIENNLFTGFKSANTGLPVISVFGHEATLYTKNVKFNKNDFLDCWNENSNKGANASNDLISCRYVDNLLVEKNNVNRARRLSYINNSENVRFIKNTCTECNNMSISVENTTGLLMEHNTIKSCVGGIYTNSTTDLRIQGNEIYDISDEIRENFPNILAVRTCVNGIISQNIIRKTINNSYNKGIGVYGGGSNVAVVDNIITGFATDIEVTATTPNTVRRLFQ